MELQINGMEVMQLKVASNRKIKDYRESLGLETTSNRVDQGDLKCILLTLNELGFSIIRENLSVDKNIPTKGG